jgi:AcrR family transcriptional regulator
VSPEPETHERLIALERSAPAAPREPDRCRAPPGGEDDAPGGQPESDVGEHHGEHEQQAPKRLRDSDAAHPGGAGCPVHEGERGQPRRAGVAAHRVRKDDLPQHGDDANVEAAAGVSKPLLYHYFPSKIDLFKAAVAEAAGQLQALIEPSGDGTPAEQLAASLDGYLAWIESNARTWIKLMQSAATLSAAADIVEGFRARTMNMILAELTGNQAPQPALRTAVRGWLGYMDAAILDWTQHQDLPRDKLRDLLLGAFVAALLAAQQLDPEIQLTLG